MIVLELVIAISHVFCPCYTAFALPAIDTGLGVKIVGKEDGIVDMAVLNEEHLAPLPNEFTICSSISTQAFTTDLFPFQLLHDNGEPWVTFRFWAPGKTSTHHQLNIKVRQNTRL